MKKLLGLVAAAGVGYVAGLLFAPKSGKETRSDIKSKLDNLKETTSEKIFMMKVLLRLKKVLAKLATR